MHESMAAMWCVTPFVCMTGRRNKCLSWSTMWANNTQKIKNQKPVAKNINNACTSFTIIKSGISGIKDHQWHLPPSNWLKLIKITKMDILDLHPTAKKCHTCSDLNTCRYIMNKTHMSQINIYYIHIYIIYGTKYHQNQLFPLLCPVALQPVQKHELQGPPWTVPCILCHHHAGWTAPCILGHHHAGRTVPCILLLGLAIHVPTSLPILPCWNGAPSHRKCGLEPQEMSPWMALMKNKMQEYFEMFM